MDVSVVIASYNVKEYLKACLKSIMDSTRDVSYEVIVVDNASADGSADMVEREFPHVQLVRNTKNRGFASACNQGIARSRGKFILLLNSDTVVTDGALKNVVRYMAENQDVGIVACKNLYPDGTLLRSCCYFPNVMTVLAQVLQVSRVFPERRILGQHRMPRSTYGGISEIDWASGAALALRRSMLDMIGSLDENFFFYGEEMELCYRAKGAGWKVVFFPGSQVIHFCSKSAEQEPLIVRNAAARSTMFFFRKHRGAVGTAIVMVILLVARAVRLALEWRERGAFARV